MDRPTYTAALTKYKQTFSSLPLPSSRGTVSQEEVDQARKDFSRELSVLLNGKLMPLGTPARFAEFVRAVAVAVARYVLDTELTRAMKDAVDSAWGLTVTSPPATAHPTIPKPSATPNTSNVSQERTESKATGRSPARSVRAHHHHRRSANKRFSRLDALSDGEGGPRVAHRRALSNASPMDGGFHSDVEVSGLGSLRNRYNCIALRSLWLSLLLCVNHRSIMAALRCPLPQR